MLHTYIDKPSSDYLKITMTLKTNTLGTWMIQHSPPYPFVCIVLEASVKARYDWPGTSHALV